MASTRLALGSEAGGRLAARIFAPTSPDTLLRLVSGRRSTKVVLAPCVLGIDDWVLMYVENWSGPLRLDTQGSELSHMRDQLAFKLVGWAVAKRLVQALGVVDLLDEPRQTLRDILECLVATDVDVLDLQRLRETLCLGIVVRATDRTYCVAQPGLG